MAFVAVLLAFALTFTSVSVPAEAATTSVKSITVKKVITVTVGQPVTGVKLSKTSLIVVKGKIAALKATVTPAKVSNKKTVYIFRFSVIG